MYIHIYNKPLLSVPPTQRISYLMGCGLSITDLLVIKKMGRLSVSWSWKKVKLLNKKSRKRVHRCKGPFVVVGWPKDEASKFALLKPSGTFQKNLGTKTRTQAHPC